MREANPPTHYLRDYLPANFLIDEIDLHVSLHDDHAQVRSELRMRRNPKAQDQQAPLVLDGEQLELIRIEVDGQPLAAEAYQVDDEHLHIHRLPERCTIRIENRIHPHQNTALEGLYVSQGNFFTQCEAQGFRRITYFLDRPDVLARYTTTIEADRERYPVLLSNGNLQAQGELAEGRHFVTWHDPFPKPSYLFALVAGDLARVADVFTTASGRQVDLHFYVRRGDEPKCAHAIASLKRAMRWDEEQYGREYDLDLFMVVAVSDFNMGAMENKGLNIFNAQYVLASRETATDSDYEHIEAVVAHEYFHNWTGNRITCRDWFQLSLKEGLTVFREQQFCADMHSAAVKRIQDVQRLRTTQFPEDAGPLAHPVRPASYIEINNFYTPTVYEKGAEVIRMLHVLLGPAGFRRGMDLYFARHDGQAVTIDDFVAALADANGVDLQEFKRWYDQAGTPHVKARREHDPATRRLRLILRQHTPPSPGQPDKQPLVIPIRLGLLNTSGEPMPLRLADDPEAPLERVLQLREAEQVFEFAEVEAPAIVSLLRGFSAPVHLHHDLSRDERLLLVAHDQDAFNRWDAAQQLMAEMILEAAHKNGTIEPDPALIKALSDILADAHDDPAWAAEVLEVPAYDYLAGLMEPVVPDALDQARENFRRMLGQALEPEFKRCYEALKEVDVAGARRLKNRCLAYLCATEETPQHYADCCRLQYLQADNMTDALAALACLSRWRWTQTDAALADFYQRWRTEDLVVNKWFSLQAAAQRDDVLAQVRTLLGHPAFDIRNPNRVRALIGAFCRGNPRHFHAVDGSGYAFLLEQIKILAPLNPQVAARLIGSLTGYRRYAQPWQDTMHVVLNKIIQIKDLPKDIFEVVEKSLQT